MSPSPSCLQGLAKSAGSADLISAAGSRAYSLGSSQHLPGTDKLPGPDGAPVTEVELQLKIYQEWAANLSSKPFNCRVETEKNKRISGQICSPPTLQ